MEAGINQQNALIQLLRQRERRLQRMVQFLAVLLLLLISAALILGITVAHLRKGHQPLDSQALKQSDTPGISLKQQQLPQLRNPSAMLTAPYDSNINGKYLEWESEIGNAHCHGGFSYSNGTLVVPRDGTYRIFLQITYESNTDQGCFDELIITNTVNHMSDSYSARVPLLSSVDTVSGSMTQWRKSLYTAGLFSLKANGRLQVSSSHHSNIIKEEHLVFFGAELLPN